MLVPPYPNRKKFGFLFSRSNTLKSSSELSARPNRRKLLIGSARLPNRKKFGSRPLSTLEALFPKRKKLGSADDRP